MDTSSRWLTLAPIIISTVAVLVSVSVALMQYYLQKQQQRQNLFQQRYEIWLVLNSYLQGCIRELSAPGNPYVIIKDRDYDAVIDRFTQATFFFGPEVLALLYEITHDELLCCHTDIKGKIFRSIGPFDNHDAHTALQIFREWARRTDEAFRPYLQLHQDKNLILRMFERIDRWTTGVDRVLASRYKR